MDFYQIMIATHICVGILLFSVALVSVSIAVVSAVDPAADKSNAVLVERANTVGLIENIIACMVTLTGLGAMFLGSFSLSELWLWMSLSIMVFYSLMLVLITKPARLRVARGGSAVKTGMQVLYHVAHILLIIVSFAFMLLKPV
jgi:hypothetical protein